MDAPPPDAAVRLRLKCPDAEDFVARFSPNVTRGGVFLPTHHAREVGSPIRFEIALSDDTVVFAGDGVVTWVKPKGMGVKFTTLDPATEPMLERLLNRRQAAPASPPPAPAPAREDAAAAQASPAPSPPATDARPTPAAERPTPAAERPTPAAERPTPAAVPATDTSPLSIAPAPRRPLVRVAVAASAVFVGVAVIWMSVGRARVAARPVAAPAVEIAAPAAASPAPSPEPPSETPPTPTPTPPVPPPPAAAATEPTASARPGALHVESILVSASYKNFTCPDPARRISVKSTRTVNVCLQVAHKTGKTDRLTLVWERNGAFSGKTPVEIPAAKPNARTRVHMKISANRLGPWSVRVVGDRNAPLAQTDFEVVP